MNNPYRALIVSEAARNGLPPDIADAVAAIESGYDPPAIGGAGEIGLMQVRPETAAMLGYTGDLAELARPDVNIHYGVIYLGQAWHLAKPGLLGGGRGKGEGDHQTPRGEMAANGVAVEKAAANFASEAGTERA